MKAGPDRVRPFYSGQQADGQRQVIAQLGAVLVPASGQQLRQRADLHQKFPDQDLIAGIDGLWELVLHHSRRVPHGRIRQLLASAGPRGLDPDASAALMTMVRYDLSLREVLVEKGKARPDQLDFLFGRPLTRTLPPFGVTFTRSAGELRIVYRPVAPPQPDL